MQPICLPREMPLPNPEKITHKETHRMDDSEDSRPRVIGMDLHPDSMAAVTLVGQTARAATVIATHQHVAASDIGAYLERHTRATDVIVVEAGNTSFAFEELASKLQRKVIVLNSTKAGQIGKSYCKNDMLDAHKLGIIYLSGLCDEVWVPDAQTRTRRSISHGHGNAVKDATQARNRLKSFLTSHGIRLGSGASVSDKTGQERVRQSAEWDAEQLMLIETMIADIDHAEEQRRKLVSHMAEIALDDDEMIKLMKLCGVGLIAAYKLMAVIGDIGRFANPKKLVAYFGLNPGVRDSGERQRRFGVGLSGRSQIRVTMVQCAQAILRSGGAYGGKLRKWGLATVFRKGRNIAVIAVARKLTVAAWYLLRGFYTPLLQDAEKSIRAKVARVIRELGTTAIGNAGYESVKACRTVLLSKLLGEENAPTPPQKGDAPIAVPS